MFGARGALPRLRGRFGRSRAPLPHFRLLPRPRDYGATGCEADLKRPPILIRPIAISEVVIVNFFWERSSRDKGRAQNTRQAEHNDYGKDK